MTSVICAIVKNEQRFIKEWVEHNLKIGFDKLYIFEDFGSKSHKEQLSDLIEEGKVDLVSLQESHVIPHYKKGTSVQKGLYNYFLNRCKKEGIADWCAFIDVDEFIMFEKGWGLKSLEREFKDFGGVLLCWKNFGANGHVKRPEGKVVDNYTTHLPEGSKIDEGGTTEWNIKSLTNIKLVGEQRAVHVFGGCVFTDHKSFKDGDMTYGKAWINHYFTKSWEDYCDRMFSRGNMHNNYRCFDKFFKVSPEFMPKKKEMVMSVRYRHATSTMWISREMKIISGGNVGRLNELRKKYIQNA
jgi:hypothetical protein